jgi:hypothetical protein
MATWFQQPSGTFEDAAYRVGYRHESRNVWYGVGYKDVGDGFRADLLSDNYSCAPTTITPVHGRGGGCD